MRDDFYVAWRYVRFHWRRSALLVVALSLILYIPLALRTLVTVSERQLMARAESTPLLLGTKGSSLDLAVNSLYFEPKPLDPLANAERDRVRETGYAEAIPLHVRYRARDAPIVGTTLGYFAFRGLQVAEGRMLVRLGDCVLGANAAKRLGLGAGDSLVSSPENLFDLAGVYPLKMRVTGVFGPNGSPDDDAVFVDVRTAWIIEGLGHGHQDMGGDVPEGAVLPSEEAGVVRASAQLVQYTEITDANVDSFHFHGDMGAYPLTAILLAPPDRKSEDLLRGRYLGDAGLQVVRPVEVVRGLLATIFKIEGALHVAFLLMGTGAGLLTVLVVLLSMRLRERELRTLHKLGASRGKTARLIGAELTLLAAGCLAITGTLTVLTTRYAEPLLKALVF
jgi:putative ABC transport system permease protein